MTALPVYLHAILKPPRLAAVSRPFQFIDTTSVRYTAAALSFRQGVPAEHTFRPTRHYPHPALVTKHVLPVEVPRSFARGPCMPTKNSRATHSHDDRPCLVRHWRPASRATPPSKGLQRPVVRPTPQIGVNFDPCPPLIYANLQALPISAPTAHSLPRPHGGFLFIVSRISFPSRERPDPISPLTQSAPIHVDVHTTDPAPALRSPITINCAHSGTCFSVHVVECLVCGARGLLERASSAEFAGEGRKGPGLHCTWWNRNRGDWSESGSGSGYI